MTPISLLEKLIIIKNWKGKETNFGQEFAKRDTRQGICRKTSNADQAPLPFPEELAVWISSKNREVIISRTDLASTMMPAIRLAEAIRALVMKIFTRN